MKAKLFLDKIAYFNGSNKKEALNNLAQCEEDAQKMKAPETTAVWSKLTGRANKVMREESRQHEGTVAWEIFQSMLIKHFYHIPNKERAAKLLNKLQQDPHKSIGEYVKRGSEIIQVHSVKINLRDILASQYGWNLVQGLNNVPIKSKTTDCIATCNSLSDVCKLIRQVRREMENREAFTGISAEPEETVEEVNWRQNNYNQRGRGYPNRGSNRGSYTGNHYLPSPAAGGSGYNTYSSSNTGSSDYTKRPGNSGNPDVICLICGLKGHKVTACRKLPRAQELIRKDKDQYWKNKRGSVKRNAPNHNRKQQINEVDEEETIYEIDQYQDEDCDRTDYDGPDEIIFPTSKYTEEEDQAYYNDN